MDTDRAACVRSLTPVLGEAVRLRMDAKLRFERDPHRFGRGGAQILLGYQVGVNVVVSEGTVLVRTSDAVDPKLTLPVIVTH
jgi:hypothetical protein